MRLWHYALIPYLPKCQLLAQWRELNSIFKKQDKHILINYIYEYPKDDLLVYALKVITEIERRNININSYKNYDEYFKGITYRKYINGEKPFKNHHNDRYLMQCFYNLQEKYDRGQADFDIDTYIRLEHFIATHLLSAS